MKPTHLGTRALIRFTILLSSFVAIALNSPAAAQSTDLARTLLREPSEKLVANALSDGDASRGAFVFYQPAAACANCHASSDTGPLSIANVGPNLTRPNPDLTNADIVDSILRPSKSIAKGFETTQVLTSSGQLITGILVNESKERVELRDPSTGKPIEIASSDIDEIRQSSQSIMPEGVAGQITSRQQFLDLVRFLIEIRDGGPLRAKELKPAVMPTLEPLPEYEARIDHAGIISSLNHKAFKRGEEIYNRSCVNCHGAIKEPGSLPTSLRFASEKFKNGHDPFAMYQTITKGFGMMIPQRWMVPQQKYDVIHYIREAYLKNNNPTQYASVSKSYLKGLPKGDTRGPEPSTIMPWQQMDYGPNLMLTVEVGNDGKNFAYKGHAIRLDPGVGGVAKGNHRILYEHDSMRVAAAWTGDQFIDWNGINFNGAHQRHPRIVGDVLFSNGNGPGWANPENDSFTEVRDPGRDGRFYGPLPKIWIDYKGTYVNGDVTILHYRVGGVEIHEEPSSFVENGVVVFQRQLQIGASERPLTMRVADRRGASFSEVDSNDGNLSFVMSKPLDDASSVVFGVAGDISGCEWLDAEDQIRLKIPPSKRAKTVTLVAYRSLENLQDPVAIVPRPNSPSKQQKRWPEVVTTNVVTENSGGPFAVDTLSYPVNNPWFCRMRLTGVDFYADGEAAVISDWDGNVWKVSELHSEQITWTRIASGLFQPLGIKIRDGEIFVSCRDQICRLHDSNGDGETDYYESFNHDHQVTDHFHEFAMGLQTDSDGNFYYAKSARHALTALVPHHGTLLKVSADGSDTTILANGFRAANGVCVNRDGTFFVTDQEGHWNPKNRINWVKPGEFYGNMYGYHDVTDESDSAMQPPMCWITNAFDRSPAELVWVESKNWGSLDNSLLNLSYGYGKLYVVPHERVGDLLQGGMCELPLPQFPTGIMRGRFHPTDGGLYLAGMFSWAGTQQADGGLYRVRATGKPMFVPKTLSCTGTTIRIGLTDDIDPMSVTPKNFQLSRWAIKRSKKYGSDHIDTQSVSVASARWESESRQIILEVPDLSPTWCMSIEFDLKSPSGEPIHRLIHNTIHSLNSVKLDSFPPSS